MEEALTPHPGALHRSFWGPPRACLGILCLVWNGDSKKAGWGRGRRHSKKRRVSFDLKWIPPGPTNSPTQ
jgi:hypothetical protein